VKAPRFRIAWVMVGIAIAALDFAAIRAMLGHPEIGLLVLGALPMANVLIVGTLVAQQRPGSRPFLLGFGVFGAMTLALFVALVSFVQDSERLISSYLALLVLPMDKFVGSDQFFAYIPLACSVVVVMLTWPQVAFALIGGFLSRRFKVTITRRS
jgi:hypothetical protein